MDCSGFYPCDTTVIETHSCISQKTEDAVNVHSPHGLAKLQIPTSLMQLQRWPYWNSPVLHLMLSFPVSLPRPRRVEAGPLTCGDYRRHPGEPLALTFHYIFHYISHPFSWWQLAPWLLRRGNALRSADLISSHTRPDTHLYACAHTNTHRIHCCLLWLTPDYRFLFTSRKVTGQAGGSRGLWQLWHLILICCYLVSRMHPCLHPGQIWLVEKINIFQCYKQL